MVEAQAAGDAELVGHRQRAFAEERELIELVTEVGEEQRVLGRAKALRRNARQVLEADDRQRLPVVAVCMTEEDASHEG